MEKEPLEYKQMTDEQLIEIIRQGDTLAQDYILNKYKVLVKSKARAYFIIGADKEDIIQEGMIGLYKAIRDFQGDKCTSFRAFAELCINRQIITAIKSATRQKHIPLNSYVSLNKPLFDEDSEQTYLDLLKEPENANPETLFIGQEDKDIIETHMGEVLSAFEAKVLSYYLKGKPYVEIARLMNKQEKSIDNALQRVKKKIEKFMAQKNGNL